MHYLVQSYRHLHKATQKLVNVYSPHICLNHLSIKDNATEKEIYKNIEILKSYYISPEYAYLMNSKK